MQLPQVPRVIYNKNPQYSEIARVISRASVQLDSIPNKEVVWEARQLLQNILEAMLQVQGMSVDLSSLPELSVVSVADGSILIEWVFPGFRVGFTVEPDPKESGWYLVSTQNFGGINASGYMSGIDTKKLLTWLFYFIVSFS